MEVEGYSVKRELGKGGMATVYLAVQESFRREVALKVMAPQLVADPTFAERFLREARIVAHLAHPSIVSVYDVGVSGDHYFLAMELHTGGDLAARIAGGIDHIQAIDILRQIAGALEYAHSNGYVHRDIKPGNVLFSHHGHVVLTDFGIAKAADASTDLTRVKRVVGEGEMTKEGSIVGTPSYMSPEQARGQSVDGRADLYSLGIMLFEMLTQKVPYQATDPFAVAIMHINEPVPTLPEEHAAFQPILARLLAKDPDERFQTGAELIEALRELEAAVSAPTATPEEMRTMVVGPGELPQSAKQPGSNRSLQIGGITAAVVIAAAAAAYFALSPGAEPATVANQPKPVTSEVTTETTETTAATVDTQSRIQELLAAAEVNISNDQLATPPGNNALDRYRQVFELDPGNREAREGQIRVADRYLTLAKDRVRKRQVASARRYVDKVAEFAPAHPELAATTLLVTNAEQSVGRGSRNELRIMGLLGNARRLLGADQLTSPKGDNAYDKYRSVLKLDPNHPEALEGVQKVASRYLQLAKGAVANQDFDSADEFISKAAKVSPGHPGLSAARSEARRARQAAGT